jgi:putative PIN family toxin of toxin-antitoxin system
MSALPLPLPAEGTAPRVVLDTNVVMSLWHYRHPRMMALREWMERRRAVLLTREECLDELERVLGLKDFDLAPALRAELLVDYRSRCLVCAAPTREQTEAARALPQCRDRDDQMFLRLAWETGAHLLLTRDKRLLAMNRYAPWADRTAIITPERLQKHLDGLT